MKKLIPLALVLLMVLTSCEYATTLPESICIKADNLTVYYNQTQTHIEDGQVEIELKPCDWSDAA